MLRVPAPFALLLFTGCAALSPEQSRTADAAASLPTKEPNWAEIDKTVQRVRERENTRLRVVETERVAEHGFFPMTDEEYQSAVETAREDMRKKNPQWSDSAVEKEAVKLADQQRRRADITPTARASSTYELKR